MGRKPLAETVFQELLQQVIEGVYPPHSALPAEAELARTADVSRLTVREALKTLQAQNVVQVRRGLGTFVNPPALWTNLEAIIRAASHEAGSSDVALRLLEVRRMVETGAAELAARHATGEDLARMAAAVDALTAAHNAEDLDAVVTADLDFHDAVLRASANPFVPVIVGPLGQLLYAMRRETSAFREVQKHAIRHHTLVLDAIRSGEPEAARRAMEAHINQTYDDYEHFIHHPDRFRS
ncbi:FadR/GntR family transcriptional regulator [Arthrobacter zhaoguopingii]|uniref:FadR/GntR family transcriptional regulator n=1 Tax=Arthrobacter zhaoguopingii TaxID=2681491 RepID=UPI001357B9B0|nr:FadR/GntR family transcriptional regulator [Arthrobacter zhaoguopingii]